MHDIIDEINIEDMIYEIRGKQVMLDSDLAKLYHVETKRINEAVKNNPLKFPNRYCFKLNDSESKNFLVEIFDQKNETRGGRYKNPRVFTEQGVAMLSTILKSKIATQVSLNIMDAFVNMRKYIKSNLLEQQYINTLVLEHDNDIKLLQESFDKLEEKELKNKLFFNGQVFDSYIEIIKILNESKKEIIIIDNYADITLLEIIKDVNKNVILITNKRILKEIDIEKYNKQYHNLNIIYNNEFHDRFIIIDKEKIYHIGTSINHVGNKIFAINIIEEEMIKELLFNKIKDICM